MTDSAQSRTLTIPACDGFLLSASCFGPDRPDTVLVVAPATGVRRSLYRRMAEHLGQRGFAVITFDYRGTGGSRPDSLRGFEASMVDWAVEDLGGVIEWSSDRFPKAGRVVLGHSYGGCAVGLAPNAGLLDALVAIASPNAYWGYWPFPQRYGYAALWYAGMPALAHLCGYFPGRALGLGEDLPLGVALQWARWS
ncbi:alpha/beta hydrolase family protein, partial [Longibacter sp.]|uniref:alpha/beta hydrolase family protein n=1 Tax=Longibacter sp. TaxID=2045415 RepID=UPI003EC13E8C